MDRPKSDHSENGVTRIFALSRFKFAGAQVSNLRVGLPSDTQVRHVGHLRSFRIYSRTFVQLVLRLTRKS